MNSTSATETPTAYEAARAAALSWFTLSDQEKRRRTEEARRLKAQRAPEVEAAIDSLRDQAAVADVDLLRGLALAMVDGWVRYPLLTDWGIQPCGATGGFSLYPILLRKSRTMFDAWRLWVIDWPVTFDLRGDDPDNCRVEVVALMHTTARTFVPLPDVPGCWPNGPLALREFKERVLGPALRMLDIPDDSGAFAEENVSVASQDAGSDGIQQMEFSVGTVCHLHGEMNDTNKLPQLQLLNPIIVREATGIVGEDSLGLGDAFVRPAFDWREAIELADQARCHSALEIQGDVTALVRAETEDETATGAERGGSVGRKDEIHQVTLSRSLSADDDSDDTEGSPRVRLC